MFGDQWRANIKGEWRGDVERWQMKVIKGEEPIMNKKKKKASFKEKGDKILNFVLSYTNFVIRYIKSLDDTVRFIGFVQR